MSSLRWFEVEIAQLVFKLESLFRVALGFAYQKNGVHKNATSAKK